MSLNYYSLHETLTPPRLAYGNPVGLDIAANCVSETGRFIQIVIPPGTSRTIGTGLVFQPPAGYFLAVCSRSGLASGNNPLMVANAPGIIDVDYTGELKVLLYNGGHQACYIKHGDYIAQLILLPKIDIKLTEIKPNALPKTMRGDKGFGSSDGPRRN